MKYAFALSTLAVAVAAQGFDPAAIPACAIGCGTSLLPNTGCGLDISSPDFGPCLCKNKDKFAPAFVKCAKEKCSVADQCKVYKFSVGFCAAIAGDVENPCPDAAKPSKPAASSPAAEPSKPAASSPAASEPAATSAPAAPTGGAPGYGSSAPAATGTEAPTGTEAAPTGTEAAPTGVAPTGAPAYTGAANALAVNAGAAIVGVAAFFAL
jgi:hypothetical protein